MMHISHAKKAQDLATETKYRTFLHEYTTLPTDMNVSWAKRVYGQQSDVRIIQLSLCNRTKENLSVKEEFDVSVFRSSTGQT